jgi:hypothetical protein
MENEGINFDDIANVASILSLLLTIYVLYTVRKIKNYYVFKARVPELVNQISDHASKLALFHNDYENSREQILLELGKAEVTLSSLKKKVDRKTRRLITTAITTVQSYNRYTRDKDQLWKIYIDLQKVVQEVINVQGDREWESHNA